MHKECQMKKFLLGILLIMSSFFIIPSGIKVNAESATSTPNISTIYPLEVEDYHDLSDIHYLSANDSFVAYTLNNKDIIIYYKDTKKTRSIAGFENVLDIKFVNNKQLIVVDYAIGSTSSLKYIDLSLSEPKVNIISKVNLTNLKLIDIYEYNKKVYVGIIRTTSEFELYTIDNSTTLTNAESHHKNTHTFYTTATNLTITDTQQYVVNSDNQILISEHSSQINTSPRATISNIKKLKYICQDSTPYLLAFTGENMYILPENEYEKAENNYFSLQNMQIQAFTDIDIYENNIYICDSQSKSIRNYNIAINNSIEAGSKPYTLTSKLWLASSDKSKGRFNNVSNIFVQGDRYIVSDTSNNRIQIIEDGKESIVISDGILENSNPHSVLLDRNQNIYFVVENSNNTTSSVLQYSPSNNEYSKIQTFSTFNSQSLGLVSDSTIDSNNTIYLIDYSSNTLVSLTTAGLQTKYTFSFTTSSDTKIDYLTLQNMLVVLNNDTIYLLDISDPDNISNVANINVDNCKGISTDLDSIYALSNNTLQKITISSNDSTTMQISDNSLTSAVFAKLDNFSCDIANGKIIAFRNDTQSLIKFNCELMESAFSFDNFSSSTALSKSNIPLAITIEDGGIIYDYPYYLGNYYLEKTSCIGVGKEGDYYRVLFEDNKTLKCGFIHKDYVPKDNILPFNTSSKTKVITTDQQVPVYKYPTLLKSNGASVITQMLPTQTSLYVYSKPFPISIDQKQFYLYENGDAIGFLFNANIVEDNDKHIVYLHTENASINAIGEDEINIYGEDKETIVKTIKNSDRIYVETYDKNSEYTKVIFKDTDQNTSYEGYVKTKYIQMDKLDNSRIVLILIIVFSVVILVIIATSYIVIKKRK